MKNIVMIVENRAMPGRMEATVMDSRGQQRVGRADVGNKQDPGQVAAAACRFVAEWGGSARCDLVAPDWVMERVPKSLGGKL